MSTKSQRVAAELDLLIGAGDFVGADQKAQTALSAAADEFARERLLDDLATSFTRHPHSWAKPVGFTSREFAAYWENFATGARRLSETFLDTADSLKRGGRLRDARRHFEAAGVIMAAFGDTSGSRTLALQGIWETALALGEAQDSLLAARCFRDLTPNDDVNSIFAEEMLGVTLLELGKPREAIRHFENLLEWWERIDHEKGRADSPATLRARQLLLRAQEGAEHQENG